MAFSYHIGLFTSKMYIFDLFLSLQHDYDDFPHQCPTMTTVLHAPSPSSESGPPPTDLQAAWTSFSNLGLRQLKDLPERYRHDRQKNASWGGETIQLKFGSPERIVYGSGHPLSGCLWFESRGQNCQNRLPGYNKVAIWSYSDNKEP